MSGSRKYLFILNPKLLLNNLQREKILADINGFFKAAGEKNCTLHISTYPRSAIGFIRSFAKELPNETILRVYAVGDEGILFDCLNGVMGLKKAELAAVPYGRTDNFVRGFGKDKISRFRDIEKRQFTAPVIPMDVIRCGANYALSSCVIGTEAYAARFSMQVYQNLEKDKFSRKLACSCLNFLFYFWGWFAAILKKKLQHQKYSVNIDGEAYNGTYQNIIVLNGKYYGSGMFAKKSTMPNDGLLDIFLEKSQGFFLTLKVLVFNITGRCDQLPQVFTFKRGRTIHVSSDEPLHISLDGEPFFDSKFSMEVLPGALQFVDASVDDVFVKGDNNK